MPILTFQQLEDSLINAIDNCPTYYGQLSTYLSCLMKTGCRPTEILLINRWAYVNANLITLQPLKGNNQRQFNPATLPVDFVVSVQNQFPIFQGYNYRKYEFQFSNVYSYPSAFVGSKQIGLYLYRHWFIKNLHNSGYSIAEIKSITGHLSNASVYEYLYSQIIVP